MAMVVEQINQQHLLLLPGLPAKAAVARNPRLPCALVGSDGAA